MPWKEEYEGSALRRGWVAWVEEMRGEVRKKIPWKEGGKDGGGAGRRKESLRPS